MCLSPLLPIKFLGRRQRWNEFEGIWKSSHDVAMSILGLPTSMGFPIDFGGNIESCPSKILTPSLSKNLQVIHGIFFPIGETPKYFPSFHGWYSTQTWFVQDEDLSHSIHIVAQRACISTRLEPGWGLKYPTHPTTWSMPH